MYKLQKNNDYEQEADRLSYGISKKSASEKELKQNMTIHLDHSVNTETSFGRRVLGHEMVHAGYRISGRAV